MINLLRKGSKIRESIIDGFTKDPALVPRVLIPGNQIVDAIF